MSEWDSIAVKYHKAGVESEIGNKAHPIFKIEI